MYRDLSVAVVIPAFNEERAISHTLRDVPEFVDRVIVIDDASSDATASIAQQRALCGDVESLEIVRHPINCGVGRAIVTGYHRVLHGGLDVAVVMAGDGQMDSADLTSLLDPIADGRADYTKGNRFLHRDVWRVMPPSRIVGNILLSTATKITSGYWHVFDSQCGYTAITRHALEQIDLERVFSRYGYPNDVLARLHASGMRVVDVPVRPIYGPDWKSGIRLHTVIHPVAFVLLRSWTARLVVETGHRLRRSLPQPGNNPSRVVVRE
ncbi:MAG: glycosyltransferase family 2 protein [Proteobacteria bacterium]|nr:glycosyltransferase family 2 protein [Pseudomonadota bacterium]